MLALIPIVEANLKLDFAQENFALAIDGWSNASTHYVGMFAIYINVSDMNEIKLILYIPILTCAIIETGRSIRGANCVSSNGKKQGRRGEL
jgi:hypothetical protein